jgi:hypothetical protein
MKTHRVRFCILSISATLLLLALSACKPCGCSDADLEAAIMQLLPGGLASAHFHFESPWFSEDRFTLELRFTNPPPAPLTNPLTIRGSYSKSGDTITFRPEGGITGLIVGGAKYDLKCPKDPKRVVIQRVGTPALTFDCTGH